MYYTTRALRYLVCLINIICAIFGSLLIWYGAWLLGTIADQQGTDHGENLAAVLYILLGIVIVLACIFGTVGVCMESKTILISYAVLLILLLAIQFIMFSISFSGARDAIPVNLKRGFDELWDPLHVGNSSLNVYEEWLQCCGRNSAEDYFRLDKKPAPSCCYERDCTNVLNLFLEGCESKYKQYVREKSGNFHLISWLLMITELLGSVATCYLVDSIRNHRDRVRFYN